MNGTIEPRDGFDEHQWVTNGTWGLDYMKHHTDLKELLMCMCQCPLGFIFPAGNEESSNEDPSGQTDR